MSDASDVQNLLRDAARALRNTDTYGACFGPEDPGRHVRLVEKLNKQADKLAALDRPAFGIEPTTIYGCPVYIEIEGEKVPLPLRLVDDHDNPALIPDVEVDFERIMQLVQDAFLQNRRRQGDELEVRIKLERGRLAGCDVYAEGNRVGHLPITGAQIIMPAGGDLSALEVSTVRYKIEGEGVLPERRA